MAQAARVVELPYTPRKAFLPYHYRKQRWAVMVAHRRAGKTVACINDIIARALSLTRPHGRYAYVAPYFTQAKDVAWEYLKRFAGPALKDKNESELWVELVNGARIRVYGADNPDRLRGSYLDGCILDEYADFRAGVWGTVIRPMLADRHTELEPTWATFIGTPKGRNEFFELWEDAGKEPSRMFRQMLKASESGILAAAERAEMVLDLTPDQILQEMECSFDAAIQGAYFGALIQDAEREGRIREVEYDPAVPVYTSLDLGIGDSTAIWWFQIVGSELHFIDHYEAHSQDLDHFIGVLAAKPYVYGLDFLPHDAKARELIAGRSRAEHWAKSKRQFRILPQTKVEDSINAGRLVLPRCYFDRINCAKGLEALRQYRSEFDDKTKAFKDKPRHDWACHSADAFKYASMGYRELTADEPAKDPIAEMLKPKTFNDLMEEFEDDERRRG
jgi:phage terminase large subunit